MGFIHSMTCGLCGAQDYSDENNGRSPRGVFQSDDDDNSHEKSHGILGFHRRSKSQSRNHSMGRRPTHDIDTNPALGNYRIRDSDVAVTRSEASFGEPRLRHEESAPSLGSAPVVDQGMDIPSQAPTRNSSQLPMSSRGTNSALASSHDYSIQRSNTYESVGGSINEPPAHSDADRPVNIPVVLDGSLIPGFR